MAQTIVIICLAIFCSILIGVILYLKISKSYKANVTKMRKEVKQIRKQLLNKTYREIAERKLDLKRKNSQEQQQIQLEWKQLQLEKELLNKSENILNYQQQRLDKYEVALAKRSKEYDSKMQILLDNLADVSGLSKTEAKQLLLKQIKRQIQKETVAYFKNVELETLAKARNMANDIVVDAMERYATEIVHQKTTNIVKLPNDEIKGRIIGREGRNLRSFEQASGVDLLIDETPSAITVSSFNPIRREIATRALEKLIKDGRIQPARIEAELNRQKKAIDSIILESGYQAIQELGITEMELPLIKLVGKLKYRTSYGQNALHHSLEVAKISGSMAAELGLNANQAARAGLLHDIGKAVDFEEEGSHVTLGANMARTYNEDEVIINAIEAHHEDVPKTSVISSLVAIADAISAARPGARNNSLDDFFKRMQHIERLADELPGVEKIFAFQSGRQIRVIVDPDITNDQDLVLLLNQLKKKILKKVVIPGEILITVIRERRLTQVLKK